MIVVDTENPHKNRERESKKKKPFNGLHLRHNASRTAHSPYIYALIEQNVDCVEKMTNPDAKYE